MNSTIQRRSKFIALTLPVMIVVAWIVVGRGTRVPERLPTAEIAGLPPQASAFVEIPSGTYYLGENSVSPLESTRSASVELPSFVMQRHEVTNAEFQAFVNATGYISTAEQTGEGHVFVATEDQWLAVPGANWRHPRGPDSSIAGKNNHPVVQVSFHDARAYAKWSERRLPTEAEWIAAVRRGGEKLGGGNTFQGWYPLKDSADDGYAGTAPVGSYPPNGYGLHDMSGNVREWCSSSEQDPKSEGTSAVRRGSFWLSLGDGDKILEVRDESTPQWSDDTTGFRCAADR